MSLLCKHCSTFKGKNAASLGAHVWVCKSNPDRRTPGFLGKSAWNKGNRSKPDTRDPALIGRNGGYRANAGRSKKYLVRDSFGKFVTVQSSYEFQCANILNELSIRWVRPKQLCYGRRKYYADFYLVDYDIFLDPKNDYKAELDRDKIEQVMLENSVRVYILLQKQINKDYILMLVNGEATAAPDKRVVGGAVPPTSTNTV